MRPLKLTVEGFTAFRTEQVLDLEPLDLFAIVGPTGSGKSSLLDAMTFALYGQVARVDDSPTSIKELVSQGLPWMKVMLEFEVGSDRYRITRRTPSSPTGAAKVLLERIVDGEARQFGPGAERVKEVREAVEGLVGLDYDGFTRSVLLPQGRFAELLTGKAPQRRKLLTDLLDLELFERMSERARRIGHDAERDGARDRSFIDEHLAHATAGALSEARRSAAAAGARERELVAVRGRVEQLAARWDALTREAAAAERLARDAERQLAAVRTAAKDLGAVAVRAAGARAALDAAAQADREARDLAAAAAEALADVERTSGPREAIIRVADAAARLPDAERAARDADAAVAFALQRVPALERVAAERDAAAAAAAVDLERVELALLEAKERLEEARHGDLIAQIASGLRPGDACPICGTTLADAPAPLGVATLDAATAAAEAAERARDDARGVREAALRDADAGRRDLEDSAIRTQEAGERASEARASLRRLRDGVAEVLGAPLPTDPVAAIRTRIDAIDRARERSLAAEGAVAAATERLAEAKTNDADVRADAGRLAGRLEIDVAALEPDPALASDVTAVSLPPMPGSDQVPALIEHAAAVAAALDARVAAATGAAARRETAAAEVLAEASDVVDGSVPPSDRFEDLRRAVADAALDAREARTRSAEVLAQLDADVERRAALEERVSQLDARHRVFQALANDLRSNRIIDFLQGEALRILGLAGSEHLSALSGGRYRLEYQGDEFAVIDAENGDERRSARTLSGGETFLASLSLALALAGQVRSLSVSERAPLESLFLDEGFGTLDPDTLEVVAGAIEQLGGDGRLVGIVTHVKELAERAPVRVEVRRASSGRGSELVSDREGDDRTAAAISYAE
jgi:exonuclease SbcC